MSGNKITDLIKNNAFTFSFEITPSISMDYIENLTVNPTFFSVTWHAKSHECKGLDIAPLKLASDLRRRDKDVLLHLSCDLLKREYLNSVLKFLQEKGICNLFVILGESYDSNCSDFNSTKELIEYIKKHTGSYFCLGVAGYPDDSETRLHHLKEKIDIGGDFIITQAFFEFCNFRNFVVKCKNLGITIPIIPGIFVYETHKELMGFANVCQVKVSNDVLEYIKCNDPSTGRETVKNIVLNIKNAGFGSNHCHIFTLNKLNQVLTFLREITTADV